MSDDNTRNGAGSGLERRVQSLLTSPLALVSPMLALLGLTLSALFLIPLRRAAVTRAELPGPSPVALLGQPLLCYVLCLGFFVFVWMLSGE
jgi:hypothetical protein